MGLLDNSDPVGIEFNSQSIASDHRRSHIWVRLTRSQIDCPSGWVSLAHRTNFQKKIDDTDAGLGFSYFFWDAQATAKHISTQGLGFFLHGSGCFSAYLLTLSPFLLFCGPNFLIVSLTPVIF